ncbi:MAG: phosphotransferase [Pseudomonadota bacterium]
MHTPLYHALARPLLARRRRSAIVAAAAAHAELAALRIGPSLAQGPKSGIFAASYGGAPVVVKIDVTDKAADAIRLEAGNLAALYPAMAEGPLRLPRPVLHIPEAGIGVTERAKGRRLSDALRGASTARRARAIEQVGAWLALYTAARRRRTSIGPFYWAELQRTLAASAPRTVDRTAALAIAKALASMADTIRGSQITQAIVHGDLTARNLMWDGTVMTGIDTASEAWWPLSKDAARFLVQLTGARPTRRLPGSSAPPPGAIAEADRAALAASGVLRSEPPAVLDFFTGVEIGRRLCRPQTLLTERGRNHALARAWLACHAAK